MSGSARPSHQKRRKVQNKEPPTSDELADLWTEPQSDFSSDSDKESSSTNVGYDTSEDEDKEYILQKVACLQTMVEGILWENHPQSMKLFPFTKSECLLQAVSGDSPIDYFRHFLTDNILHEIISETNDYARKVSLGRKKKHCQTNVWSDTTKEELLVFIGLILHMGTMRMNRIQDYWKSDRLFGLRVFAKNMSRNRFLLLLRALHFTKIPDPPNDRLYKIRHMVDLFNARLSEIYYPGREINILKPMALWNGRFNVGQYLPNERQKHVIKLYMSTTPNGMVLKFRVDRGMLDDFDEGHAQEVVLNLLDGMLDVGHSVLMDNYYTSYELSQCLADRQTHCTGTIGVNRKTFPREVSEKKLKKEQTIAKYAHGIMIAKWKDKRDITYISNEYSNDMVETTNQNGEHKLKPLPIIQYNKFMTGIEKKDQTLAYYPCDRKTMKWPTKILVHILQIMMTNSYFIYNKYCDGNISFYDFRLSVIKSLLKQPSDVRVPVRDHMELDHVLVLRDERKGGKVLRKQCKSCYSQGKRKDTIYICKVCEGSPGYCLDCAIIIHK